MKPPPSYVSLCHIILSQRHEHDLPFAFTSMICLCLQAWDALPIGFKVRPEKNQVWSVIAKPSCYVIMSWAITELHYCNGLNLTKKYKKIIYIYILYTSIYIYIYLAERSNLPQSRSIFFFSIFRDNKR